MRTDDAKWCLQSLIDRFGNSSGPYFSFDQETVREETVQSAPCIKPGSKKFTSKSNIFQLQTPFQPYTSVTRSFGKRNIFLTPFFNNFQIGLPGPQQETAPAAYRLYLTKRPYGGLDERQDGWCGVVWGGVGWCTAEPSLPSQHTTHFISTC